MGNSPIVNRINAMLAEKGISKQEFYEACGITSASYSLWNTGKTTPRRKNLEIIADFLNTTVEYLLTGFGEKEKAPSDTGEGEISEGRLKAAFFRGADPTLTDEEIDYMWDDAKDLRDLLIMKMRREKGGK